MRKTCPVCKNEFTTNRSNAICCSGSCRIRWYRERHGIVTRQEPWYANCQNPRCDNPIPKGSKANRKYCSGACRKDMMNKKYALLEKDIEAVIQELMK